MALQVEQLITDHLDLWTQAQTAKSTSGRGSNNKIELTGIKKLRELILELAVRGKLVPQDPTDEPASELLKRIAEEKEALVKAGKLKKQKPFPRISDEEKPFELPKGWAFLKLGSLLEFEYGDNLPEAKRTNTGEFPVYGSNGVVGSHNVAFINAPCIVIGRKGSAGALNLCMHSGCCVTDVAYYCIPSAYMNLNFVFKLLHTLALDKLGKGIKPGLNRNEAYELIVSLPPFAEQNRIVAKVDELMALCDQLEQQSYQQLDAHNQLVDALLATLTQSLNADELASNWQRLAAHFDTLFTTEYSIDALKQTILQLAVMGKLVKQDPSDEPASELLKRIAFEKDALVKAGKIKKQKSLPPISDDEKPFELPEGWEWCRLGWIAEINPRNYAEDKLQASFVPMTLIGKSHTGEHLSETRDWGDIKKGFTHFANGDLAVAKITPCFENSKAAVFHDLTNGIGAGTTELHIARFISAEDALAKYLLLNIKSPLYLKTGESKMTGTAGQKRLPKDFFEGNPFALPPKSEQGRIVNRVNELFELCDALSEKLNSSKQTQVVLAEALVEQVVA
ncbi:restriction endonuclease subunit S [Rheinheimera metallidurans]|uniref:restriction endonuclease subunit S n=1 Tax=Rheinheimera metallidurans TaxID=2925781 RepID=UPI0030012ACD